MRIEIKQDFSISYQRDHIGDGAEAACLTEALLEGMSMNMPSDTLRKPSVNTITKDDGRERGIALHQAGKFADAAAVYGKLLEAEPNDADLLGLLAGAQLQLGSEDEALATWRKSLSVAATVQERLRAIANFLMAARQRGVARISDLVDELVVPDWPADLLPDHKDGVLIAALADSLVHLGRKKEALGLLDSVLPHFHADNKFLNTAVHVMLDAGESQKALQLLRPLTLRDGQTDGSLLIAHAAAANVAGLRDEGHRLARRAIEAVPVHLTAKEPNQLLLVGVLNPVPLPILRPIAPLHLHFSSNTPADLALRLNDEYRFLSIFPEARSASQALASLPRPHVVLNNWVNGERLSEPGVLRLVADFADRLGLPILNHPRHAAETTRQHNATHLAGIPNLVVPRLVRFLNDSRTRELALGLIGEKIGYPVIIRTPFSQKGKGAAKIDTPEQLKVHLASLPNAQLYAIQFVDNPISRGVYRKIRAAVIGSSTIISHVHFGSRWNVHRERKAAGAFTPDGSTKDHAERILAKPDETLGGPAMAALDEIRRRIPLDLFGIDFDILPDGQVLFFEANAAMHLSMRIREGRQQARSAMRTALRRLFQDPPPFQDANSPTAKKPDGMN